MIWVVHWWWRTVAVHPVSLVILPVEGEIVLGLEMCTHIARHQKLDGVSLAKASKKGKKIAYSMVAQWFLAPSNPPLCVQIASDEPDEEEERYPSSNGPLDYLGFLSTNQCRIVGEWAQSTYRRVPKASLLIIELVIIAHEGAIVVIAIHLSLLHDEAHF